MALNASFKLSIEPAIKYLSLLDAISSKNFCAVAFTLPNPIV